jgi:hypothetical protein
VVGKRQTDEISLKTALISPFTAQSKMLKTASSGYKRNSPNIINVHCKKEIFSLNSRQATPSLPEECAISPG